MPLPALSAVAAPSPAVFDALLGVPSIETANMVQDTVEVAVALSGMLTKEVGADGVWAQRADQAAGVGLA